MTRFQVSRGWLFVCSLIVSLIASTVHAFGPAQDGAPPQTPTNVYVAEILASVFEEILSASPTFAAQIQRVGNAKYVHVVVKPVMASSTISRGSARTTMRRFSSGALLASVDMPVPLTTAEYAELFGHEFEHIIEQIDHVDLAAQTLVHNGATRLPDGAYETTRARRTGQLVADEADRPRPIVVGPLPVQGRAAPPASAPLRRP